MKIDKLRVILKQKKVSLNNYIICCAKMALSQIAVSQDSLQVSIPFTVKDYPETLDGFRIGNDFAALPFLFKFPPKEQRTISQFKPMLKQLSAQVRSVKTLFLALGFYYMMRYFVGVLRWKMCFDWKHICNNYTTVFSCVPGPRKDWVWKGHRIYDLFYLVPGAGALGCGIGVITHGDSC